MNKAASAVSKVRSFVNLAVNSLKKVGQAVGKIDQLPGLISGLPNEIIKLVKTAIPWLPFSGGPLVILITKAINEFLLPARMCIPFTACLPDDIKPKLDGRLPWRNDPYVWIKVVLQPQGLTSAGTLGEGGQKQSNDTGNSQHSPNTPNTGLRECGNDTSRSTGRSGRQKAATRRNMRREERVTVQAPVKKQQRDGMSHRGDFGGSQFRVGTFAFQMGRAFCRTKSGAFREVGTCG